MIFLDTETTGLDEGRLVELAYNSVVLRCRPPKKIELEATVVNGITDAVVASLPLFIDMPEYAVIKNQLEHSVIIAHNASYDIAVLEREGIQVKTYICTKELAREKWPDAPSHSLQALRYWLGLKVHGEAHTAGGDVAVLRALWERLHADGGDGTGTVEGEGLTLTAVTFKDE